jgi:recombination protein RecT
MTTETKQDVAKVEQKPATVKGLLSNENVKKRFEDILNKDANGFMANLAIMVNNSAILAQCDAMTVVSAAIVSASLKLPLDPNLGFAAIVPYNNKQSDGTWKKVAQFQIMYKGLVQLAMRSGQYETIGVSEIYEGQLISENPLTSDYVFDFSKRTSNKVVGYAAYFRLSNGFHKTVYRSIDDISEHGKKYSKTFSQSNSKWKDDFDAMAKKTVLKQLLSKWGILSIEMQQATIKDQAVIQGIEENAAFDYVDNDGTTAPTEVNDPFAKAQDAEIVTEQGTLKLEGNATK